MADKVKLSERTHPLYEENISKWELYKDSVKGGEDFINEDNLFSHRLEDSEDYDDRLERAYYLNYCELPPSLYNKYIFKEKIERPPDPILDLFRKNTDARGTIINEFIKRVGFFASVYGAMHVLVDIPAIGKKTPTRADEKQIVPYAKLIYPYQLRDWSVDDYGRLNWIITEHEYYRDLDPTIERESEKHYKLITRDEWKVEDEDGNPVKYEDGTPSSGTHKLQMIPMATLYHMDIDDDKVGESMLKDIVYNNRIIMNWCSCIDEQIERQTFSQLVVPDNGTLTEAKESGDDPLAKIGTGNVFTFPSESGHPPMFISPNTTTITVIWDLIVDHIKEIFRMAGLMGSTNDMYVGTSGRAAQMGFIGVNSNIANKANSYQIFENTLNDLVYLQLGKDPTFESVKYSESFDVTSLNEEIESVFKIMEKNFSVSLNKHLMKSISRKAAPLAPDSVRDAIEKEIDSHSGVIEVSTPFGKEKDNAFDKGEGPKKTDVSDNMKTKSTVRKEQTNHERN